MVLALRQEQVAVTRRVRAEGQHEAYVLHAQKHLFIGCRNQMPVLAKPLHVQGLDVVNRLEKDHTGGEGRHVLK